SRDPASVKHGEGLTKNRACFFIKCNNTAAKTAAQICKIQRQSLLVRRNSDINNAVENNRRSSDDCCRMGFYLSDPPARSGVPIYGNHVGAIVGLLGI